MLQNGLDVDLDGDSRSGIGTPSDEDDFQFERVEQERPEQRRIGGGAAGGEDGDAMEIVEDGQQMRIDHPEKTGDVAQTPSFGQAGQKGVRPRYSPLLDDVAWDEQAEERQRLEKDSRQGSTFASTSAAVLQSSAATGDRKSASRGTLRPTNAMRGPVNGSSVAMAATSSSSSQGSKSRHSGLPRPKQKLSVEDLDADVLAVLLQSVPEYSWEDQASAPVPPRVPPAGFVTNVKSSLSFLKSSALFPAREPDGDDEESDDMQDQRPARKTRKGKKSLGKAIIPPNEWVPATFPWGHAPHYPPKPAEPLLLFEYNTGNKARGRKRKRLYQAANGHESDDRDNDYEEMTIEEPPYSSVISSPYVRIPPYTYCTRVSTNWRTNKSIKSRCHLSFLPYFNEGNFEDEDEFREALGHTAVKIAFHIPNEMESDDEPDLPDTEFCGICMTRGCVQHRESCQSSP